MTELTIEDTRDDIDILSCPDSFLPDHRHGSHGWEQDEEELWCPGSGHITVSWSELSTFRQCPKKHDLAYTQRWAREQSDTSALGLGTLWHRVLEEHYKTIKAAQVTNGDGHTVWNVSGEDLLIGVQDAVNSLLTTMREEEKVSPEALQLLKWMYRGHLDTYGLDEGWDILAVESSAVITLKEADGSNSWIRLKVKLDLLIRDERGVWVVDHKSTGQIGRTGDLDWDDQFGLYISAMRRQGIKVIGAWHSAALKKANKGDFLKEGDDGWKASMKETPLENRFKRTPLNRTDPECDSILDDARESARLAYSDANHKRRTTDPQKCQYMCDFNEACMFGRRTNDESKVLVTLQRTGFAQEPIRH